MGRDPSTGKLLLRCGHIPGAVKMATIWLIPKDAEKPIDGRMKKSKEAK